jgi:hypothetical protein
MGRTTASTVVDDLASGVRIGTIGGIDEDEGFLPERYGLSMSLFELFMVKEKEILVPVVCFNHSVVYGCL